MTGSRGAVPGRGVVRRAVGRGGASARGREGVPGRCGLVAAGRRRRRGACVAGRRAARGGARRRRRGRALRRIRGRDRRPVVGPNRRRDSQRRDDRGQAEKPDTEPPRSACG